MLEVKNTLCEFCKTGYHAPFERFEKLSVSVEGPTFLRRCKLCGTLWNETLHDAKKISLLEATTLYPEISLKE